MELKHVFDNSQIRALIAEKFGVSQQALTNWKKRGIPAEKCPDIEALTGIKCEKLRPDVNWSVLRVKEKVVPHTQIVCSTPKKASSKNPAEEKPMGLSA